MKELKDLVEQCYVDIQDLVRVNNLANAEAMLNIAAHAMQLAGIIWGFFLIYHGAYVAEKRKREQALVAGFVAILVGLATPGCINWLVASERYAHFFG